MAGQTLYTTRAALDQHLSALGVDLYAGDAAEGTAGGPAGWDEAVAMAIERGSADVDYYCQRYSPVRLAAAPWVQSKALTIALWYLCGRRANERPKEVVEDYQEAVKQLTLVLEGKARVPGVPTGKGNVPSVTNQRVVLDRYPSLRTERPRSVGTAEGYRQQTDTSADGVFGGG